MKQHIKNQIQNTYREYLGVCGVFVASSIMFFVFGFIHTTSAAPNYEMNYQGKLTNASNVAVADDTYNMRFWILTSPTIATTSALWTEELTGSDAVQVSNGLFSIMLGSTTPLTGIDWNQTLYLGVEIGGTSTPAWDGEMSPRKILGTVPSAFEAENAQTLGGIATTSFLRSDEDDTASGLLTFTGGFVSTASSTIAGLTTDIATTTTLVTTYININGTTFDSLLGSGLTLSSNDLTCRTASNVQFGCLTATDWTIFNGKISSTSLDTSAELAALLDDETGTGSVVFSTNPLLNGFRSFASSTIGDGTGAGGLTVLGNSTTTGMMVIGDNSGSGRLTILNSSRAYLNLNDTGGVDDSAWIVFQSGGVERSHISGGYDNRQKPSVVFNVAGSSADFNSATWMRETTNDTRFGIGTTSPSARLHVVANDTVTSVPTLFVGPVGGVPYLYVGSYNQLGNVGIGTSSPSAKLSIHANVGDTNPLLFTIASSTASGATTSLFVIDNQGNVGVGFDPSTIWKLNVNGNVAARGFSDADNGGYFVNPYSTSGHSGSFNRAISIGTSSPYLNTLLTVAGDAIVANMTATGTLAVSGNTTLAHATSTSLYTNTLGLGTDYITDITGSGLLLTDGVLSATGDGLSNWLTLNGALTPSTTLGIRINASSTIGDGTGAGGLTVLGNSTTTGSAYFGGNVGIGIASPAVGLHIYKNNGTDDTNAYIQNGSAGGGANSMLSLRTAGANGVPFTQYYGVGVGYWSTGYDTSSGNFLITSENDPWAAVSNNTFYMTPAGAFGIGSSTPSAKLTIEQGMTGTGNLFQIASSSNGTATTTHFVVDQFGNVGIGTSSPVSLLSVAGLTTATNFYAYDTNATTTLAGGLNVGAGGLVYDFSTGETYVGSLISGAQTFDDDAGIVQWTDLPVYSASLDTVESYTASIGGNEMLTIYGLSTGASTTYNNRVGIGTSTPSRFFTVAGDAYFTNNITSASSTLGYASSSALTVSGNTFLTYASTTGLTATNLTVDGLTESRMIFTAGDKSLSTTGASEQIRLALTDETGGGGYVVFSQNPLLSGFRSFASSTIGDGTGAGGLTVLGNSTTTGNSKITGSLAVAGITITDFQNINMSSGDNINWGSSATRLSGGTGLNFITNSTNRMVIGQYGNIGIGTTTPESSFVVQSSSSTIPVFTVASTSGSSLLTVLGNGSVGVGTSSPSAKLTISGTAGNAQNIFTVASSTGSTSLAVLATGDVEVPGNIISAGINWTTRTAASTTAPYQSVAYGNGRFVAVGTNFVMTSPDGVNWSTSTPAENSSWKSVTYGNGLFVAVATSGRVMTSPDGITWTSRTAGGGTWYSVTYGNGLFVAVAIGGSGGRVMTSPDGITWTKRSAVGDDDLWMSVTYGNGLFVAVSWGGGSGGAVMTSPDGINWTHRSAAGDDDVWQDVTYGNGLFVAVSAGTDYVVTSPDGINWTIRSGVGGDFRNIEYGNGLFVITSTNSSPNLVTSPDGINWTTRITPEVNSWYGLAYGNGLFVAVSTNGTNRVMTSGKTFTNALAHNNIYQGGMSVLGGTFNIGTTTPTTSPLYGLNVLNIASTSGSSLLTISNSGNVGIGTTTPTQRLSVSGDMRLTGALYDSLYGAGTNGMVLQTTGTGVQWVATSTLGLGGAGGTADGMSNWLTVNGALTPSTTLGIRINASSTIGDGTGAGGLTIDGNSTTTGSAYFGGNVGMVGSLLWSGGYGFYSGGSSITTNIIRSFTTDFKLTLQSMGRSVAGNAVEMATGEFSNSSGTTSAVALLPTYNQSGTSAGNDLYILRTETAIGSGAQYLINAQTGGALNAWATSTKFSVDRTGLGYFAGNLGIGSSTPSRLLTVAGDAIMANLTATGTVTLSNLTESRMVFTAGDKTLTTSGASEQLRLALTDETGDGGYVVFSQNPLLSGFRSYASSTIGDGTGAGGLTILGNSTTTGISYVSTGLAVGGVYDSTQPVPLQVNGLSGSRMTATQLRNTSLSVGSGVGIQFIQGTVLGADIGTVITDSNNTDLTFSTRDNAVTTEQLRITGAGNVGIGTSTPSRTLTVAGDAYFTNNITSASSTLGYASSSALTATNGYFTNSSLGYASSTALTVSGLATLGNISATNATTSGALVVNGTAKLMNEVVIQGRTLSSGFDATPFLYADEMLFFGNGSTLLGVGALANVWNTGTYSYNTAVGMLGLGALVVGNNNTSVGSFAFSNMATGTGNVAFGYSAGSSQTEGDNNIVIGNSIDLASTTGSNQLNIGNLLYGTELGSDGKLGIGTSSPLATLTIQGSGTTNPFTIASSSGSSMLTVLANGNVGIGSSTPVAKLSVVGTGGSSNVFAFASSTGSNLLTLGADGRMVFGNNASADIFINGGKTTANPQSNSNNVAIGNGAFTYYTSGSAINNTAIGYRAFYGSSTVPMTGDNNVAIGYQAGYSTTWGQGNFFVGEETGYSNIYGSDNIAIGSKWSGIGPTFGSNTTGSGNIALGQNALSSNTTGDYNIALGAAALNFNTTGNNNIAQGYQSQFQNGTGSYNNALGNQSLFSNTKGSNNIALGNTSGYNLGGSATSSNNTFLGAYAGQNQTQGDNNIFIGYDATVASTTGSNQLSIGNLIYGLNTATGANVATGTVGIGTSSPRSTLTIQGSGTTNPFAIASSTGSTLLTLGADGRMIFGNNASADIFINGGKTTANPQSNSNNVAIGNQALTYYTSGSATYNTATGYQALYGSSTVPMTGDYNVAMGYLALTKNTTGSLNVAIGDNTLLKNSTGSQNVAIGTQALKNNVSASSNIAIGNETMKDSSGGFDNIALGQNALNNNRGSNNIAVGSAALYANGMTGGTAGSGNSAFGSSAGFVVGFDATSSLNSYFGSNSGYNHQHGDATTFLGAKTDTILTSISTSTAVGAGALLARSNTMVLGGTGANSVDIVTGTSTPWAKFSIMNNYGAEIPLFDIATTTSSAYATSSLFTVLANGNVGIGTSTPSATLTIQGSGTTNPFAIASSSGSSMLTVLANGNVGIGTTSPSAKLSIHANNRETNQYLLNIASSTASATSSLFSVLNNGYVYIGSAGFRDGGGGQLMVIRSSDNSTGSLRVGPIYTNGIYSDSTGASLKLGGSSISDTTQTDAVLAGYGTYSQTSTPTADFAAFRIYPTYNQSGSTASNTDLSILRKETAIGSGAQYLINAQTGGALNAWATSTKFSVDRTGLGYFAGKLGIGTTTPVSLLTMGTTSVTTSGVAGLKQYFSFMNPTASSIQYGDETYIVNAPTATSTLVGKMIRIEDTSTLGNTVRGLEAQAFRGTNTKGENTGLSGYGRTFGVRGTTLGDAGSVYVPAGIFAESQGTTQGNALRAYSGTITSEDLVSLFHDGSAFTGTGLSMNFGNSGGSFAATSSAKFIDFQVGGTSKFTITGAGTTTIGDGTTANMAGLQIGFGGLCVDNDGSCTASTTGRITSVSSASGNSDLAEMYFSSDALESGEIVSLVGGLSVGRAQGADSDETIIGVVSTKPGLIMGFDDTSLSAGETAYPIALKGRVPIKLSTENGPIAKGDRIALSSIPGVGMKAEDGDTVVGIALEDYSGEYAYSPAYLNQFGSDLVKAKMQARSQETDPRTQDGCSYGGGNAQGEAPCVKDKVAPIKPVTVSVDTKTSAMNALKTQSAEIRETEGGQEVTIGQAIMFVHLHDFIAEGSRDVLAELSATSSVQNGNGTETLWDRVKALAQNFVDGVLRVTGIKTEELCVGNVCVDEATFLRMVEQAGGVQSSGGTSTEGGATGGGSDTTDNSGTVTPPSEEPTPTIEEPTSTTESPVEEPPLESTDSMNPDSNGASNQVEPISPEEPAPTPEPPII